MTHNSIPPQEGTSSCLKQKVKQRRGIGGGHRARAEMDEEEAMVETDVVGARAESKAEEAWVEPPA